MKHLLVTFLFWASLSIAASAAPVIVENPPFVFNTHSNVTIERIVLGDSSTVLNMLIYGSQESWIRISSDTYLNAGGKKYKVQSSDGIALDQEVYSDESGKIIFSLIFPPIDPATQQLDFIESDCNNCFKIYGLALKPDVQIKRASVPQKIKNAVLIKDDGKSLPVPRLKAGKAVLKGKLIGYVPAMNTTVNVYVTNPVTNIQEELETKVKEDGGFELKIPLVATMQVLLRLSVPRYNKYVLLSPGKESSIYFDLPHTYFGGANAEINNQIEDKNIEGLLGQVDRSYWDFNTIAEMTAEQYKSFVLEKTGIFIAELEQKGLTKKAFGFVSRWERYRAIDQLINTRFYLENAFRKKHNLEYGDPLTGFTPPEINEDFYSFLKDFSVNDPYLLYYHNCGRIVSCCKYLETKEFKNNYNIAVKEVFQALIDSGKLLPEELETAAYLRDVDNIPAAISEQTETDSKISKEQITGFIRKHTEEINSMLEARLLKERKTGLLSRILGTDKGLVYDLLETQLTCAKMEELTPLTADELQPLSQMDNPFYFTYLTAKNKELLAQIEANKRKGAYTIHETPETNGEQAFREIVKKFEGKVVFVDFWATWCGPCRFAMKQFEPSKNTFKEKGVVFIYLTDETSPLTTWNNMIPSIEGEHFRLNNNQMEELKKKFGIRGIPSYLVLNKQGEQIYFKTGFDFWAIEKKLTEALEL